MNIHISKMCSKFVPPAGTDDLRWLCQWSVIASIMS